MKAILHSFIITVTVSDTAQISFASSQETESEKLEGKRIAFVRLSACEGY